MGGPGGPVVPGRGGDVAGGGRRSIGASGGRGWEGRGRGGGVGGAVSPGSASMVVLAWRGRVWAVVAGCAAGLGCGGTMVLMGAGGDGAVGVLRGSGRGVARRGWTWALIGVPHPAGGRAGGSPDLAWCSWPGGCWGRVNPPVPVGGARERACQRCASLKRASRPLMSARWSAGSIRVAVASSGAARWASRKNVQPAGGQVGVPKGRPALRGPQLAWDGGDVLIGGVR